MSDTSALYITLLAIVIVGAFVASLGYAFGQARKRQRAEMELKYESSRRVAAEVAQSVASGGPVDLAALRQAQQQRDAADFEVNAAKPVSIEAVSFTDAGLFQDATWQLQPGVNVLLGRNGYGKSLLLRELAALLSRSDRQMLGKSTSSRMNVTVRAGDKTSDIVRGARGFEHSLGPVPVLAIPDSRFVNRSEETLRVVPDPYGKLGRDGAYHFVEQLPYNTIVEGLLHSLCLDYFQNRQSFESPIFALLTEVFRELTDSSFRFDSIERVDATGFHLNVMTEGNPQPVPIQVASQGTLSVLTVFGVICRQLEALARHDKSETPLRMRRIIVIIDELDAHLHPSWQQRIVGLLRKHFPNIQFIISAHSPLLVAGAGRGETSVLRKQGSRFGVVTLEDRDFIGATAADIYDNVFDVADGEDEVFVQHSKLAASKVDNGPQIAKLREKQSLSYEEQAELQRLLQEDVYMRRAQAIEQSRTEESKRLVQLETDCSMLRIQVRKLEAEREQSRTELAKLREQVAAAKGAPLEQGAAR